MDSSIYQWPAFNFDQLYSEWCENVDPLLEQGLKISAWEFYLQLRNLSINQVSRDLKEILDSIPEVFPFWDDEISFEENLCLLVCGACKDIEPRKLLKIFHSLGLIGLVEKLLDFDFFNHCWRDNLCSDFPLLFLALTFWRANQKQDLPGGSPSNFRQFWLPGSWMESISDLPEFFTQLHRSRIAKSEMDLGPYLQYPQTFPLIRNLPDLELLIDRTVRTYANCLEEWIEAILEKRILPKQGPNFDTQRSNLEYFWLRYSGVDGEYTLEAYLMFLISQPSRNSLFQQVAAERLQPLFEGIK